MIGKLSAASTRCIGWGWYEKRYEKKEKKMEEIHITDKKNSPMASTDSLFECCRLVARVKSSQTIELQDFSYHFCLNSRITSSGDRFR